MQLTSVLFFAASALAASSSETVNMASPPALPGYVAFSEASTASSIVANPSLTVLSGTRSASASVTPPAAAGNASAPSPGGVAGGNGTAVGGGNGTAGGSGNSSSGGSGSSGSGSGSGSGGSSSQSGNGALATGVPAIIGAVGLLLAL